MNPWKGLHSLPRSMWILTLATLINRMGTMVLPFLILYLTQDNGISPGKAGFVLTCYGAGALISAPFAGKLSDRIGPVKLMKISLFGAGFLLVVFPFFKNFYSILILSFILSGITEAFRPAGMSFISSEVEGEFRKIAFALHRFAINLGMSIGPVIGGFLSLIDFSLLFYVDGFTSISAGFYLLFSKLKPTDIDTFLPTEKETPEFPVRILGDHRFIYFLIALIPVSMIFFQHLGAMPLFLVDELGFKSSTYGLLMAVNTVMIIFLEIPLNNLMIKWRDKNALALGALLSGLGFGLMYFTKDIYSIIFSIVIWTFGEMIFFPAGASYVSGIASNKKRGEYMGYFQMTFSFAFMIGPWMGTIVFENYGSGVVWAGTFILGIVSTYLMYKLKNTYINASE